MQPTSGTGVEGTRAPSKICLICKKQFAKYTCPKCNLPYCSLQCYKSHGNNCTEKFYQEHVKAFLQSQKVADEDKRKMISILKKVHEQQQDEEEFLESELDNDLMEKIMNMDLDAPESFEELTKEQQEEFRRAVADGRVGKNIQIWDPWWTASKKSSRVVFLSDDGKEVPADSPLPSIPQNIPPLSTLIKTTPSPLLAFSLLDVLYSYCFTARLYNGDLYDEPLEVLETVLQLSDALAKKRNYSSATEVVQQMIENSLQPSLHNSVQFSVAVIHDVWLVLSSSHFILSALSDVHKLFQTVITQEKSQATKEAMKAIKEFELSQKKVWFFLVWAKEQPEEIWKVLQFAVEEEHNKQKEVLKANQKDSETESHFANINKKEVQPNETLNNNNNTTTKKKVLIEEIS